MATMTGDSGLLLRRLKLRDLHTLIAVVEHGNMAKAAQHLAVTRPVISKTISDIEATLGVRLLDRSPQGLEPTPFGRALLTRSVAVFDELRQALHEMQSIATPDAGELRIGASEYMAAGIVPVVIDRMTRRHPQLRFELTLGDGASLQTGALRERKVDFAIARMLAPAPEPDVAAEVLFHEQVFVAAGPGNTWIGRRRIRPQQLVGEPWILAPPELAEGSPIVAAFRRLGLKLPDAQVSGLSLPLRNGLLATGRFLTIVPGSVLTLGAERALLTPLPVDLPRWTLPVAILTLKNRTLSPLAQRFLAEVREVAKGLGVVKAKRANRGTKARKR